KRIQPRAAKMLAVGHYSEYGLHPWAKLHLAWNTRLRVSARQQRRGQVKAQADVALKLAFQRCPECGVTEQPRHFILIFVGHELVQRDGNSCGKCGWALRE